MDEIEKLKLKGADKLAPDNKVAEVKPLPADLAKLGSVDKTKDGQGKRKADKLDTKQPFGEAESHPMLQAAKNRGALKNEDVDLLSNLYDQLDESNQEIFLNQLDEDAEVLLAFAKTIAEE